MQNGRVLLSSCCKWLTHNWRKNLFQVSTPSRFRHTCFQKENKSTMQVSPTQQQQLEPDLRCKHPMPHDLQPFLLIMMPWLYLWESGHCRGT